MDTKKKTQEQVENELHTVGPDIEITTSYTGANNKLEFRCKKCGHEGSTTLWAITHSKCGCPHCGVQKTLSQRTTETLSALGYKVIKYNYYTSKRGEEDRSVTVQCTKCGAERTAHASNLIRYKNCPSCGHAQGAEKLTHSQEQFIEKARAIHGDKYDYSKVEYKHCHKKVCIICPEHGEFWQAPIKHIHAKQGCPACSASHMEEEAYRGMEAHNLKYEREYCVYHNHRKMLADIFLELNDKKYIIELNGEQHYHETRGLKFGRTLEEQQARDEDMRQYCKENNIILIEIPYTDNVSNSLTTYYDTLMCRSSK